MVIEKFNMKKYMKHLRKEAKKLRNLSKKEWKQMQKASHNYKMIHGG